MSQSEPKRRAGHPRPKPNLALLEARIRAGLSRDVLGDLAGISGKQVGLIERGLARRPRPETLTGLAGALKEDVFVLFPERRRP
jgi:transcriptional regulator with XRE-family HTH domain